MNDIICFYFQWFKWPQFYKTDSPQFADSPHTDCYQNNGPQIIAQQIESQGIPNPWTTGHWFLGKLHVYTSWMQLLSDI